MNNRDRTAAILGILYEKVDVALPKLRDLRARQQNRETSDVRISADQFSHLSDCIFSLNAFAQQYRRFKRLLEEEPYTYELECGHIAHSPTWKSIGSVWCGTPAESLRCEECTEKPAAKYNGSRNPK